MDLCYMPPSMQCSPPFTLFHHEDGDQERCNSGTRDEPHQYSSPESGSRIQWPLSDNYIHRGAHAEQEAEDDYAWYYKHPERYIWRPRRRRQVGSSNGKDERSKGFDLLTRLNFGRDSWFGAKPDRRCSLADSETSDLSQSSSSGFSDSRGSENNFAQAFLAPCLAKPLDVIDGLGNGINDLAHPSTN